MSVALNSQGRYCQAVVSLQTRRGAPGVRSRCCRRQPVVSLATRRANRHAPPAGAPVVAHRLVADRVGLCGSLHVGCGPAGVATAACRRSAVPAAHVFCLRRSRRPNVGREPVRAALLRRHLLANKAASGCVEPDPLEEAHRRRRRRTAAANDRGRAPGGVIDSASVERVIVDSTVMPKAIAHPTDSRLLENSREHLMRFAEQHSLPLRQKYNRVAPRLAAQVGRYAHAKQFKRMRGALRTLRTRVGARAA